MFFYNSLYADLIYIIYIKMDKQPASAARTQKLKYPIFNL